MRASRRYLFSWGWFGRRFSDRWRFCNLSNNDRLHPFLYDSRSRPRPWTFGRCDPLVQQLPIHQPQVPSRSELLRWRCKAAAGDHKSAHRTLSRHRPIQLANRRHANLKRPPLLALHQVLFAVLASNQIDPAVRPVATGFLNAKALMPQRLTHQQLELLPGNAFKRLAPGIATAASNRRRLRRPNTDAAAPPRKISGTRYWPKVAKVLKAVLKIIESRCCRSE